MVLGVLTLQTAVPHEAFGQSIDREMTAAMAAAARAVLAPNTPGRVLVSTTVNSVVDEHEATGLAGALGAFAIAREDAFACATFPQTQRIDKRTCRVDGGQLIEVRAVERSDSSARVTVRIYTNEGRPLFARQYGVELERTDVTAWRVSGKVLLEVT